MAVYYGVIDLSKNELRNAAIHNLPAAPSAPVKGQVYFDTTTNVLYWWNGAVWVAAQASAPATTVTTQAIGDAPVVGVGPNFAREDHKHGMPAFGAITTETTFGTASGNGVAATLARSDHTHGNPVHDATAHATIPLSALAAATGPVNIGSQRLVNVADPVSATDGANKQYVDNAIAGLSWKDSVRCASTGNLGLTGLAAVDGVTPSANDRVLVKNQTTPAQNGIYLAQSGAWTRALDADAANELEGMAVFVNEGTVNADTSWVCTANAPITVGTTALPFSQFQGSGTYNAGAGLVQNANAFDVVAGDTSLTVSADAVIVNTAVIATRAYVDTAVTGVTKKFAAALTGTIAYATGEVVTHNLNTRDVDVSVVNGNSPWAAIGVDWEATSLNTVTIRYNPNIGAGYRAVVIG
jgi:hypothetical protein